MALKLDRGVEDLEGVGRRRLLAGVPCSGLLGGMAGVEVQASSV